MKKKMQLKSEEYPARHLACFFFAVEKEVRRQQAKP